MTLRKPENQTIKITQPKIKVNNKKKVPPQQVVSELVP